MPSSSSFSLRDLGLLVLLALLWGNSFLLIKVSLAEVSPGWIVAGRTGVGAALLAAIVAARGLPLPRSRRAWLALAVIGVVGTALPWFAQAWAQQELDSGLTAVLNATMPIATLSLAVMVGLERLYPARVLGLSIAVAGSVVVIGGEAEAGGPVWALLVAALAPIGYGIGSVVTRREISGRVPTLPAVAVQLGCGALVIVGLTWAAEGPPPPLHALSWGSIAAVFALGLLGTGVAFIIYFTLIARVGATNAAMVTYLVPLVGLSSGAWWRGETFGWNVLLGAAGLIVGIYLAQRRPTG